MGEYVHSHQARFDKSFTSCGITEVHHLPDATAAKTLFSILNALYNKANARPSAFVMFSDTSEKGGQCSRGELLALYIRNSTNIGQSELWESRRQVNPKTGNSIKVWILTLDHDALRKFYTDELANRVEENS